MENLNLNQLQIKQNQQILTFFTFSQKLATIVGEFELEPMKKIDNNFIHPYQNASIIKEGKVIGCVYKIHPTTAKDFDISTDTFISEINFDLLSDETIIATSISKFQASKRDLSVIAPKDLEYKAN